MEVNQSTLMILTIIVVLLAVLTVLLYVYPFNPIVSVQTNSSNFVKLSNFISKYNINLNNISDKDLYYFYGGLGNNTVVFGCNYEIYPKFPTAGLPSNTIESKYQNLLQDMTLNSMCSVENQTNCTYADAGLTTFIKGSMNSTMIIELFNLTYSDIRNYYEELNASGFGNNPLVGPLKYDIKLFNSSGNTSQMINAIVDMKQMTANIAFYTNGSLLNYRLETQIYSPFQFPVYKLINATSCAVSNIFNLVIDPATFSSPTYSSIYRNLGSYTNICILTNSNKCNSTELNKLNMSFYAN